MKFHYTRWLILSLLLSAVACQEKTTKKSSSSNTSNNVNYNTGGTSGGTTSGSTTGTTTGGSTTGSSTTGGSTTGGPSAAVLSFTATKAGGQTWLLGSIPSDYDAIQHDGDFIAVSPSNIAFFDSDARYKVKVKVNPQPLITDTTNRDLCHKRTRPASQDNCNNQPCAYSKVTYSVAVHDVYNNGGSYSIGGAYSVKQISNQSVNAYSPVLDWSLGQLQGRNFGGNIVGHVVSVFNVQTDTHYKATTGLMTAHPSKSCWSVQVELATDSTVDF
jgi:hypothetical protein